MLVGKVLSAVHSDSLLDEEAPREILVRGILVFKMFRYGVGGQKEEANVFCSGPQQWGAAVKIGRASCRERVF